MCLKEFILLTLCWPFFSAEANEMAPDRFVYMATISEGHQSLREFDLPYEVLTGLERRDYGDMRIFNSQNQPVPFTVRQRRQPEINSTTHQSLNFYLLEEKPDSPIQLRFDLDNSSIHLSGTDMRQAEKQAFLIIENTYQDAPLYELKLQWNPQSGSFSIPVKLQGSEDLHHWFRLRAETVLYDLKHAKTSLVQNVIRIPSGSKAKYLRLAFYGSHHLAESITEVIGAYNQSIPVIHSNWQTLPAMQQGNDTNEWLFNTPGQVAVTKIAFDIPQAGLFYQGFLYSSDLEKSVKISLKNKNNYKREIKKILHKQRKKAQYAQAGWQYQGTVTQYRLSSDSGEIDSKPLTMTANQDQHWKLILNQPDSLLPDQIPGIKIAWDPVLVTFLAQGKGPFLLYYGNRDVLPQRTVLPKTNSHLVEKVTIIESAVANKSKDARKLLHYFTNTSSNREKALLWILLCFAVLLMTFMVYRLFSNIATGKR